MQNAEIVKKIKEDAFNLSRLNDWPTTGMTPTILHGACLTTNDVEQLKMLVNEFSLRSLLPYIEKQIQHLSDVVSIIITFLIYRYYSINTIESLVVEPIPKYRKSKYQ